MKLVYTDKDLVDVLDLRTKSWEQCGLSKEFKQFTCSGKTHSFLYIEDEVLYNNALIGYMEEISEEDAKLKMEELRRAEEVEQMQLYQQTDAYKISILEAENADLLLDSAIKDSKISTLENDLADLTLEIAMMEVR